MEQRDFKAEYMRLQKKFNTDRFKRFDDETMRLFWAVVKDLEVSWFRVMVNLSIGDSRPITLSELREAALRQKNQNYMMREAKLPKMKVVGNPLGEFLQELGVNNATEAIEKIKRGSHEG